MMCVIYKWMISFYITEERQLPMHLQRHLQKCEICRNYYDTSLRLTGSLKQQASDGLHIITTYQSPTIRKTLKLPLWLKTAAMIAIVAGAFVAFNYDRITGPSQKQLECFDSATDMIFDSPMLKYTILSDNVGSSDISEQYHGFPGILKEAISILIGNVSPGIEEKPDSM